MTEGKMDIVERLLELAPYVEQQPPVEYEVAASNAMRDAAAEIQKLQAALRPFADAYLDHEPLPSELEHSVDDLNVVSITWGDCKRAYEAINSGEGKP